VVTGSMVLAFYLGLTSGQTVGFETALERATASLPRLPVPGAAPEGALPQDDGAFDVYAKLNDALPGSKGEVDPIKVVAPAVESGNSGSKAPLDAAAVFGTNGGRATGGAMPELGSIKSVDAAPLIEPQAEQVLAARVAPPVVPGSVAVEAREPAKPAPAASDTKAESQRGVAASSVAAVKVEAPKKVDEPKSVALESPSEKSPFLRRTLGKGWYAQVLAASTIGEAETVARKLKASGFAVVIEATKVQGAAYYRIVVGPETSRSQAQILVEQLKRASYIKEDPFLRTVP
jgi:cell division septation protein DedD